MILATDLRQGMTFIFEGQIFEVVTYHHMQRPRLAPLVRLKMRNFKQGNTMERTLSPDDKFQEVMLEHRNLQYSYSAGDSYHFMDIENYEQYEFSKEQVGESIKYLKEEMVIEMLLYKGEVMGIRLPAKVDLKVVEAPPSIKGDSASNITKPVTLETGAVVTAPLFVKEGDYIKVDTRTGEYLERVKV